MICCPSVVSDVIRRRIFIDDPLPPKEMTAVDKNSFFNNLSVKYEFTNFVNKSRYYTLSGSQQLNKTRENLLKPLIKQPIDVFDEVADFSSLEKFGLEKLEGSNSMQPPASTPNPGVEKKVTQPQPQPFNSEKENSQISGDDSDSEASLMIDLGDEPPPPPPPTRKIQTPRDNSTNLLSSILQDQEKLLTISAAARKEATAGVATSNDDPEDATEYNPPPYNKNVTYRVHCFRANQRTLHLLVRSSVDTAVVSHLSSNQYQPSSFGNAAEST